MARRVDIETKTEELVLPIIKANNFELVDVEYVKEGANWYLRVYADKEGGIAIDDCVLISRSLEETRCRRFYRRCIYFRSKFSRTWKTTKKRKRLCKKCRKVH